MAFPTALPPVDVTPLRGGPILRWGVIAPGSIANGWVSSVHSQTDQRVSAVGSRDRGRAQEFAARHGIERAYGSYDELAADPGIDIVYIASPHSEHLEHALIAIGAGKHVLIEKPIAVSAAEARQLAAAAKAAGVFAMEALWSRFIPQHSVVAQLLADGALGEIRSASADFGVNFPYDPENRIFNPALGGGGLLDLGVYPGWFLHFALGAPQTVTATGTLAPTGVDGQAAVTLDYASGAQAVLTTSTRVSTPSIGVISGTLARIVFPGPYQGPGAFTVASSAGEVLEWARPAADGWGDGLAYQVTAVAEAVAAGQLEHPKHTLQRTIEVLEVIDSARAQLGAT